MSKLHTVITRPVETEKAATRGAGTATFIVRRDATKTEIKDAVKKYYGLDVESVRTNTTHPKKRTISRGKEINKRPVQKKAIVKIKGGKSIDVNKITVQA